MKLSGDNGWSWRTRGRASGGIIANAKAKTSLHASLVVAARVWKSFSLFIFYDYFTTFIVRSSWSCIVLVLVTVLWSSFITPIVARCIVFSGRDLHDVMGAFGSIGIWATIAAIFWFLSLSKRRGGKTFIVQPGGYVISITLLSAIIIIC